MRKTVLGTAMALLVFTISFASEVTTSSLISPRQITTIRFLPQPLTVEVGGEFMVECVVEDVINLYGIEIQITWDTNYVSYINLDLKSPSTLNFFQNSDLLTSILQSTCFKLHSIITSLK